MPDKRRFRPRTRGSRPTGRLDAKLIIIAAEGSVTEGQYFHDLASPQYFFNSRIYVEVLERSKTASAPEHVLAQLDAFKRQYQLRKIDELWLVIDVDQWGSAKLSSIGRQCEQKSYYLAVSNPCFEIWLLFHHRAIDDYTEDEQGELLENRRDGSRTRLDRELVDILGAYNRSNLNTEHFLPHVERAVQNARDADENPGHRWPNRLGSRVYLLVEKVMDRHPRVS